MLEYRITYLDTQRGGTPQDEVNQIRGVSITLGVAGSAPAFVVGNVTMGFSSASLIFVAAGPGATSIADLVSFFTYASGKKINVSGTPAGISDGDYIITSDPVISTGVFLGFPFGIANAEVDDIRGPGGTPGTNTITITDISTDDIIELKGTGKPDGLQIIDNSEDVFTPIRARQLNVEFVSTEFVGAITFATGGDDKWKVTSWINDPANIDFVGFLVTDGMQRSFQPHPTVVQLTGSDKIPALKDLTLTDTDGINPKGNWKIMQYISWCLIKTGLDLPIYVVNNIRHSATALVTGIEDLHLYDSIYLDAKTFERIIGVSDDCYTVLTKILGEDCFIQQAKGSWWIKRINEYETADFKIALFDSDGIFNSFVTDAAQSKSIGNAETIKWAEANQIVRYRRPFSFVKETFKFESPLELVCNIDFSRGLENLTYSPTPEVIDGVSYPVKAFDPECWTYVKGYPVLTQDSIGYLKRYYTNDDEYGHYLRAEEAAGDFYYYWRSDVKFPVNTNDKFTFSVDVRSGAGGSGDFSLAVAQIRLYGSDGSHWTLHMDPNKNSADTITRWVLSDGTWSTNNEYIELSGAGGFPDISKWNSVSGDIPPLPIGGDIEIFLMNNFDANLQTRDFANLKLEYIPFINGTYARYTGQYHLVSQTGNYKANRDKQVFISDSPTKIFKGAMQIFDGSVYYLTVSFFDSVNDPTGAAPDRFGFFQAQAVWNQFRNEGRIFSGSIRYLDSDLLDVDGKVDVPEPIHKYFLTDADSDTNNKTFFLLGYDKDNKTQIWSGTLTECFDSVAGKVNGTHLFAYTMQQ